MTIYLYFLRLWKDVLIHKVEKNPDSKGVKSMQILSLHTPNYRMGKFGRDQSGPSGPTSLLKQVWPHQGWTEQQDQLPPHDENAFLILLRKLSRSNCWDMPLHKLRWKLDHMLESIVWILFDSKYEVERDRDRERAEDQGQKEWERGILSRKISPQVDPTVSHWVFLHPGLLSSRGLKGI